MKLHYRREGSGLPLVCHPGGPGFSGATLTDLGRLADSFELVVVDPRGTGRSQLPADDTAYLLEDYVRDLDELRQELDLDRIDLLGHSHGGFVAMSYAAAHPDRVRCLVLVATAPRFAPEYTARIEAVWDASEDPSIAAARAARSERLTSTSLDVADYIRLGRLELRLSLAHGEKAPLLAAAFEAEPPNLTPLLFFNREVAPTFDLRPLLPAMGAKTLVVTGDHDYFGPPAAADIVSGIESASQLVLSGAGHYPWIDQPAAFNEGVRRFLAS